MSNKTRDEALKELREIFSDFVLTTYWNVFIGVMISLIPLAIMGIWNDRIIISLVVFSGAIFGFITKVGTRFIPIKK